jgi:hypothetical protein
MKTVNILLCGYYDNVFVWDKGCDSVVVLPFH